MLRNFKNFKRPHSHNPPPLQGCLFPTYCLVFSPLIKWLTVVL